MGETKIIIVANQKGGAGKSTLCMLLGNFLHYEEGFSFGGIIDTDFQKSIVKKRESDLRQLAGTKSNERLLTPYQVVSYQLSNSGNIPEFIRQLKATQKDAFIIDTPGSLNSTGIVTLLMLADIILCPFDYDELTLTSTLQFLQTLQNIRLRTKNETGFDLPGRIILVPCRSPKNSGTREEVKNWREIRSKLSETYDIVTEIPQSQEIKLRCNTIELSKIQKRTAGTTLYEIFNLIFNPNNDTNEQQDEE